MLTSRTASGRTASGRTASGRTASGRTASGRTASGRTRRTSRTSGRMLVAANRRTGRTALDTSLVMNLSERDVSSITETVDMEDSVDEVVDLTCEADSSVVDLTSNESVLLLDEGPHIGTTTGLSYVVSSDDEDAASLPRLSAAVVSSAQMSSSRSTPGTISCPICLDSYAEMVDSGRLVVATKCGHVFCSACLRDALTSSLTCPTCRQRLRPNQYHPLYV